MSPGVLRRLATLAVLVLAPACMPLYVPPVPPPIEAPEPVALGSDSSLEARGETLVATLHVRGATASGWIFLQWYDPSLREVASDSVWLDAEAGPTRLAVALPDHVELGAGRWRVIVGFRGELLRQFETVVDRQD